MSKSHHIGILMFPAHLKMLREVVGKGYSASQWLRSTLTDETYEPLVEPVYSYKTKINYSIRVSEVEVATAKAVSAKAGVTMSKWFRDQIVRAYQGLAKNT